VLRTQLAAAQDFKLDAMLNELCTSDAEKLCADVEPGEGRTQVCLRAKRQQLSWDCQEELFRQEVENADDVRLNTQLFRKCARDKAKFCSEVRYGNARVKDCLEDNKDKPDFSEECRAEFEGMMARRATDFRLDAKLRELCKTDIDQVCGYEKDSLDSIAGYDGRVVECLQDYKEELATPACRDRVHKLTERAAADIRMDRPLSDACMDDQAKLCKDVQPGGGRVLRCLEDHREQLSYECRATLFDQEVRLAEDIDFQVPMKKACAREVGAFCKDVPAGNARVIQCLVDHDEESEFSEECRAEVKRYEIRAGQDYRLQFRLSKACSAEVDRLCADVCSPFQGQACGGTVLACLVDKRESIADAACDKELFEYEKTIANDERVDAVLAAACAADVAAHCADVEPGMGRVHDCLRSKRDVISTACAAEELKLEEVEAEDVRLRPGFTRDCSEEMAVYCKTVAPGKGRMFRCLQNNVGQADFSDACKRRVADKQARQQSMYNLDYGVRSSCAAEVSSLCADAKRGGHGKAPVLKCLAANVPSMANKACQAEVSRALRMALWQYRPNSALTDVCDADIAERCPDEGANVAVGSVGRCLARLLANATASGVPAGVSAECEKLVTFAVPRSPKEMFDEDMNSAALASKLAELQAAATAGLAKTLVRTDAATGSSAVTLTGWVALLAVGSLVMVVVGAAVFAYRKFMGLDRPYTLVVKGGDV
jgi:Golgi apparatus protein 1